MQQRPQIKSDQSPTHTIPPTGTVDKNATFRFWCANSATSTSVGKQIHTFFPWHQLQKPKLSKSSIHADDIALCIASIFLSTPRRDFCQSPTRSMFLCFLPFAFFLPSFFLCFPIFPWFPRLTKVHEHKQLRSKRNYATTRTKQK